MTVRALTAAQRRDATISTLSRALDLETRFQAGIFPKGAGSHAHYRALERAGLLRFEGMGRDIDGNTDRDVAIYRLTAAGRAALAPLGRRGGGGRAGGSGRGRGSGRGEGAREMIEVVSAVIVRGDRVLLTQRRPDKDFPLTWETPGGKVEGNESHHGALARELREEIGADAVAFSPDSIWCGGFTSDVTRSDRREVFLLFYGVDIEGEPTPREGQGIGWFTIAEMRRLTLAPGNAAAIEFIADNVRRRAPTAQPKGGRGRV